MPLACFVVLLAGLGVVYQHCAVTVGLDLEGLRTSHRTRAGTVAELLAEQDVQLRPGDMVQPHPGARLNDGDVVVVRRSRLARIRADGRITTVNSLAGSVLGVLLEADISVGPRDLVKVNGLPWRVDRPGLGEIVGARAQAVRLASLGPVSPPAGGRLPPSVATAPDGARGSPTAATRAEPELTIDVLRAVPVTVVEDGIPFAIEVAGETVGEALDAAGIAVYAEDVLHPSAGSRLRGSARIDVFRSTPFTVTADGSTRDIRAYADTVGDGLGRAGLELRGRDYAIPPSDTPLTAGLAVEVVRVVEDVEVVQVAIPFRTVVETDPALPLDQTEVLRPGEPGLKNQSIHITYENGVETKRELIGEETLRDPIDEVMAYGTRIVWSTIDTPEGPKRYWRHLRVYATSYSASRAGTPRSAPWYGRTWMGLPAGKGIIAVDPRVIPNGTWAFIPGYGVAVAGDRGGGIRGYHIDLCFDDDAYESWHWYVDIYLLEPVPPDGDMVWVLP